jgi:TRAP transporter 4TM/12TM fusion protein
MGIGYTPAYAACWAILAAILVSFIRKDTRFTPKTFVDALTGGARNTIGVALACAIAGIVIGIVSLTGLVQILISALVQVAGSSMLLALFLTMIACLILGMGIPTTANYVIMATITAPIVIRLGAPLLAAHMFVFYFGIVADITPPVALAAYAGSAIAKSNPIKTGVTATRLAITAFIIPYIFIYSPQMLLIDTTPLQVAQIVLTSVIGMFGLATGLEGWMFRKMHIIERLMTIAAGLLLIDPGLVTDLIGFALIAIVVVFQIVSRKRQPKTA